MKTLKIGLAHAVALGILLLATASPALAIELPDIHVLSGETYPAVSTGEVKGASVGTLETELGEKLTSTSVGAEVNLLELSSLGSGTLTFKGVEEPRTKTACNTAGDASGTVLLPLEWHFVLIGTTPLTPAVLLLFKELVMECNSGKLKIKVRSPAVIKIQQTSKEALTNDIELTQHKLVAKCSGKGKQELKEYLNEEGTKTKAALTMNAGLGFESACENITEELTMTSTKMLVFLF